MGTAGHGTLRVQLQATVEDIASRYLEEADGNPSLALRVVIADALADLGELERRTLCAERVVLARVRQSWPHVRAAAD